MIENFQKKIAIAMKKLNRRQNQEAYDCLISLYKEVSVAAADPLELAEISSLLSLSVSLLQGQLTNQIRELNDQAEALLRQIPMERQEKILENLEMTHMATKSYSEAQKILITLLAVREFVYGTQSLEVASTHFAMAMSHVHKNKLEATDSFKKCLSITQSLVEEASPNKLALSTHLNTLKRLCLISSIDGEEFTALAQRALLFHRTNASLDPELYGEFLTDLAGRFVQKNSFLEAEQIAQEALEVCLLQFGTTHVYTRRAANSLAIILVNLERENEADAIAVRYLDQDSNPNIPSGYYALGFSKRLLKDRALHYPQPEFPDLP
jgi:TolA-binding protein